MQNLVTLPNTTAIHILISMQQNVLSCCNHVNVAYQGEEKGVV